MQNYLADMLIRIKNGQKAQLNAVTLHSSMPKFCVKILEILYQEGFIRGFKIYFNEKNIKIIKVLLKYENSGASVIKNINVISTPGRRVYAPVRSLWTVKNGAGVYILSTPKGVMIDRDARILNLGGEVLCAVE